MDSFLRQGVDLTKNNTLGVHSQAEFFCSLHTEAQVLQASHWAAKQRQPIQVLGSGSNVILAAELPGLTCRMRLRGIKVQTSTNDILLHVAAGESWHNLVRFSTAQGWWGIETLALIPGLVGAAPIQNIGAYGSELSQVLVQARVLDRQRQRIRVLSKEECRFGYRNSLFKQEPADRFIILGVVLQLQRLGGQAALYADVKHELQSLGIAKRNLAPGQIMDSVIRIRRRKLPDPSVIGNVGSVFKNPIVSSDQARALQAQMPHLNAFAVPESTTKLKLSAAQLIDAAGGKRLVGEGFALWPRQPLVIVNRGGQLGADFLDFAAKIHDLVATEFDVRLQVEPLSLGFAVEG